MPRLPPDPEALSLYEWPKQWGLVSSITTIGLPHWNGHPQLELEAGPPGRPIGAAETPRDHSGRDTTAERRQALRRALTRGCVTATVG